MGMNNLKKYFLAILIIMFTMLGCSEHDDSIVDVDDLVLKRAYQDINSSVRLCNINNAKIWLSKVSFKPNEDICVNFKNLPGNKKDWIAIYLKDSSNEWKNVLRWGFTNSKTSGKQYFKKLPIGFYEVRLFFNNSYKVEKKILFKVEGEQLPPLLTSDKSSYKINEPINIKYENLFGTQKDWIGIYKEGSSNEWKNVLRWFYTDAEVEGNRSVGGLLDEGFYEARVFFNNSYKSENHTSFEVVKDRIEPIVYAKDIYIEGEKIVVEYSNFSGNHDDWIGIFFEGDKNSWDSALTWHYTQGERSGKMSFNSIPAGEYEIRIFFDDTYRLEKRLHFKVIPNTLSHNIQ